MPALMHEFSPGEWSLGASGPVLSSCVVTVLHKGCSQQRSRCSGGVVSIWCQFAHVIFTEDDNAVQGLFAAIAVSAEIRGEGGNLADATMAEI